MPESTKEPSGRELDVAVAERVMGQPVPPIVPDCCLLVDKIPEPNTAWNHVHYYERGDECEWEPLPFSESIEAAMRVVEKMQEQDFSVNLNAEPNDQWWVVFSNIDGDMQEDSFSETLPEAICRAALAVVGSKECLKVSA